MSWRCPDCDRIWDDRPKACGCEPIAFEPAAPDAWALVAGAEEPIAGDRAVDAIDRFELVADDDPPPPYLRRRWEHRGVETTDESGEQRFALSADAVAFLRARA